MNAEECREHAKQFLEHAKSAEILMAATRFEGLAYKWLRLAGELERAEVLLEALRHPKQKVS
jgi:hypothetical protein